MLTFKEITDLFSWKNKYSLDLFGQRPNQTKDQIERILQANCPGSYKVVEDIDSEMGVNIVFENEEEKMMWMLKYL